MRLAYTGAPPSKEFWHEKWSAQAVSAATRHFKDGFLHRALLKHLPETGTILEGGCGLGTWVYLLSAPGRRVVGLDFSWETLSRGQIAGPLASCFVGGDVEHLCFRQRCFDAYISLGVVEHFQGGPGHALTEARLVLRPGGRLLVSVPYVNPARKFWHGLIRFKKLGVRQVEGSFYQYAFDTSEFCRYLAQAGFRVLDVIPYDPIYFFRQIPPLGLLFDALYAKHATAKVTFVSSSGGGWLHWVRTGEVILDNPLFRALFSHMILFIASKDA